MINMNAILIYYFISISIAYDTFIRNTIKAFEFVLYAIVLLSTMITIYICATISYAFNAAIVLYIGFLAS